MRITIALMGVDGSGKTTLANNLKRSFQEKNIPAKTIYMGKWRNQIIPLDRLRTIINAFSSKKASDVDQHCPVNPYSVKKNRLKREIYLLVRDLVLWVDLWLRYILKILSFNGVVICDRYAYDLILFPHSKILPYLLYIYPKPSFSFLILGSPEVIRERKKQLLPHQIKEKQLLYVKICQKYKLKCTFLNAELSPDALVSSIIQKILKKESHIAS